MAVRTFSTPMMLQYQQLKAEYPDCILLFRLGDFYELFLEDAHLGAELLEITLTSRPKGKDGRIPMAGVPYHAVDSYLAKLVRAGHKVAICEQVSPPSAKGLVERKVIRVVTPGTITDEKALEKKENNYLCAVVFETNTVGLAAVDISTGECLSFHYHLEDWEKLIQDELTRLHPAECLVSESAYNDAAVLAVLTKTKNMNIYRYANWNSAVSRATDVITKQFGVHVVQALSDALQEAALTATAVIISYLAETQQDSLAHIRRVQYCHDTYLHLDSSTVANLELFTTTREHDKSGSVLHAIDRTTTAMGGRVLKQWILSPLTDLEGIQQRQKVVQHCIDHSQELQSLQEAFREVCDIERVTARISLSLGTPRDLLAVASALSVLRELQFSSEFLKLHHGKHLAELCTSTEAQHLCDTIFQAVADEPATDVKSGGVIRDGYNQKLDRFREMIGENQDWLTSFETAEKTRTGVASLKVRYNSVFGYYIEVSKANAAHVPENYIRKQTLVNGERYTTSELIAREEQILSANAESAELEFQLWCDLVSQVTQHTAFLQALSKAVATIDCLVGFADLALRNNYVQPVITTSDTLNIEGGRHPVVEQLVAAGTYTPNDCFVNGNSHQVLLITGPNMAGKSVYLRQTAVIVILAQIGSCVPARVATVGVVDRLFVRSGAADAISAGLSTFMVEMVETAHILHEATERSLVIMDEIGRGTSTYDGIAIAWAVVEYLLSRGETRPKTLFATHYHELQALEKHFPDSVRTLQMAVSQTENGPVFLHAVIPGAASHSYGVAVAELAGLPEAVVTRAAEIVADLEQTHSIPLEGETGLRTQSPVPVSKLPVRQRKKNTKSQQPADRIDLSDVKASLSLELLENVTQEINALDLESLTPLAALNHLARFQKTLRARRSS